MNEYCRVHPLDNALPLEEDDYEDNGLALPQQTEPVPLPPPPPPAPLLRLRILNPM